MAGWVDLIDWIAIPQLGMTPILLALIGFAYLRDLEGRTIRDYAITAAAVIASSALVIVVVYVLIVYV